MRMDKYLVPRRVWYCYRLLEWLDYEVVSHLSSWLMNTRIAYWDKYCTCAECAQRRNSENSESV